MCSQNYTKPANRTCCYLTLKRTANRVTTAIQGTNSGKLECIDAVKSINSFKTFVRVLKLAAYF